MWTGIVALQGWLCPTRNDAFAQPDAASGLWPFQAFHRVDGPFDRSELSCLDKNQQISTVTNWLRTEVFTMLGVTAVAAAVR